MIALLALAALMQSPAACDSVVAAARVDSLPSAIYVVARRVDGALPRARETSIALNIGAAFVPPRPLKLSVFGAAPVLRVLRTTGADAPAQLRAPNITGVYELAARRSDSTARVRVLRASLITGFDSAAMEAIRSAFLVRDMFLPPAGEDSLRINVRFSSDSIAGARRLLSANFPRMPMQDAEPVDDNPPLAFPEDARADSLTAGTVVLRFVVGRDGVPEPGTLEVIRASHSAFLRAAVVALATQRFRPAMIHGCPVAQVIDYPMSFFAPETPAR